MFKQWFGGGGTGVSVFSSGGTNRNSFIQCSSQGNTVVINGDVYDQVVRVVLETTERKRIPIAGEFTSPLLEITVRGDCERVETSSGNATVQGNCESVKTMSGDATVEGKCKGSISTMSGSVQCGNVGGSVSTMSGSVRHTVSQLANKATKKQKKKKKQVVEVNEEEEEAGEKKKRDAKEADLSSSDEVIIVKKKVKTYQ
jgi:hypothetical protein